MFRLRWLIVPPLLAAWFPAQAGDGVPGPVPARVVRVIDGDTVEVRARVWLDLEVDTRVRFLGVDAPELRGRCEAERVLADAARAYVETLVADRAVVLHDIRHDKYGGRVLARVEVAGEDVGRTLIAKGLGHAYKGGHRESWCPVD